MMALGIFGQIDPPQNTIKKRRRFIRYEKLRVFLHLISTCSFLLNSAGVDSSHPIASNGRLRAWKLSGNPLHLSHVDHQSRVR